MDAETKFSPRDDLFTVDESSQPLLVTDSADVPLMVGVRGVSRPVSRNDVATIDALAEGDVWWSLSAEDCVLEPQTDERLVESNGQRWKILTQPEIQTHGTRWKCACRRLS
jgi:phosphohistidine swiveling domain-containing protein